jgi:hypothetical protein
MKSQPSTWPVGNIRKCCFFLFTAAALTFLYFRTFTLGGTPLIVSLDETLYFEHGIRILHGQVPFRDYFTHVMPGYEFTYSFTKIAEARDSLSSIDFCNEPTKTRNAPRKGSCSTIFNRTPGLIPCEPRYRNISGSRSETLAT